MKLEIETTEDEIRAAIERKIRAAVSSLTNSFHADQLIREKVKSAWLPTMHKVVQEELENSDKMREKIRAAIENKLRGQVTALMRGEEVNFPPLPRGYTKPPRDYTGKVFLEGQMLQYANACQEPIEQLRALLQETLERLPVSYCNESLRSKITNALG